MSFHPCLKCLKFCLCNFSPIRLARYGPLRVFFIQRFSYLLQDLQFCVLAPKLHAFNISQPVHRIKTNFICKWGRIFPSLTWWHHLACLITIKYGLGQNRTKPNICTWGFTGIVVRCFRPHLNLPR